MPLLTRTLLACLMLAATSLRAQMPDMPGMHAMHHVVPRRASAAARRQIDSVARIVLPLGTTDAASLAGYHPTFGWIPTMGEHWVRGGQMFNGRQTDRSTPSQLMFSKIAGKDSLVGAAYAYFTPVADTIRPTIFDGAPAWHEHADLGPPGTTLVMLHIWFVPSPDGPFAGTNPNLPFWAVGLAAPDAGRMRDPAFGNRVRRASLALAEVADTTSILAQLERSPTVRATIATRRDSIRALIPELLAAQNAKSSVKWDRAVRRAAAQWNAIYATYLASAGSAAERARIQQYVAMLLGEHGD
jgi:hypothetical protein